MISAVILIFNSETLNFSEILLEEKLTAAPITAKAINMIPLILTKSPTYAIILLCYFITQQKICLPFFSGKRRKFQK